MNKIVKTKKLEVKRTSVHDDNSIKPDHATKIFMDKPDIFADAVNFAVYGGKQVIKPEELYSAPTVATSFVYNGDDVSISFEKIRDNRKVMKISPSDRTAYMVYGAENQMNSHYAMPVRNMLYDVMEYVSQIETRKKTFSKSKDGNYKMLPEGEAYPTSEEFLSSWKKEDKLTPSVTIVVNFGDKKWDAPLSLHEMFDDSIQERNEVIRKFIPDYKILLIDPHQMSEDDFKKMKSNLGKVLEVIADKGDAEKLKKHIDEETEFDRSDIMVINSCTGVNVRLPEEGCTVKMSQGFVDLFNEKKEEGREEGRKEIIDVLRANGVSEELIQAALKTMKEKHERESQE